MNRKLGRTAVIIAEIVLMLYAISLILPYLWLVNNSFKTVAEFYKDIWKLPEALHLTNYIKALKETNMFSYFFNSIVITAIGTFLGVMFSGMTAYILAQYKFKGHKIVFGMAVAGFLIPSVGTLAPMYVFMKNMHLFNTGGLLVLYAGGLGTNMLIYYSFFKKMSWSYAEAAFIDGAGHFTVYWKIMLPMARGATIAVSIITAIAHWNDYFMPSILLTSPTQKTVAVGLRALYVQQQYAATWTVLFAAVIVASLPTIILYIAFNDKISKGFQMGGLKE
jgi:ABC-type glycerol-3-phosphate transport system permease component